MIQQDLFAALAGVAGGRVFPNVAPNNVSKPYVVYARVSKAAIKSSAITHVLLLEQDQFEPEALLHRVILDFSIWH